ncbi:kinesin-domain-containing protein [Testicularia cyperi]|uniref:Kinesin-domain-containing protein n=1 Tax=Testicularia cyperi TaxID=1882483 RepID=A0A317XEN9_9BASI|nr:kinesin-domain-containing protein [Testicularia cyperi]
MSALRRPGSSASLARPTQPRSRAPSVAPPVSGTAAARRVTSSSASRMASSSSSSSSAAATTDDAQRSRKGDTGESNIQVVVRVRGRAQNEPHNPATTVLTTSGPRCQQIDVALEPPPVSSSSILNTTSSLVQDSSSTRQKSYHFDQVFGPEADQGMVYTDVVGPILEEVMSGYNCTIFAYGQTGTGKTFTMEGDLTSQMGTYSADAGIIPRTLYRLFHTLELSKEDYSVKSTFIELYNEELRDLLSIDQSSSLAESSGTNNAKDSQHGLRMYDDARGKGVVIQGLEEVALKDAAHGLTVLRRGSQKRQIAATNCNEQSSRSHSVFTMTVFIKDKGSRGEDVLKIGKLNLVDLAGSENIGRSGAENKRAREAGMINQSLLTLGRVINALVEKNSHIPYRESKLTRLLQESLGGRTKTCIIATVSQDRSNIEETLSTLDYALRAKSIKNRPELNTRMTRSALIKEYVHEIERLKGDLQASRDQNGIYLTQESWDTMHQEHEERKSLAETLKRTAEVTESKLTSLKEQFEQNMQLLLKRDNEVRAAKSECAGKVAELETMITKANQLEETVEQEIALRKAYKASESTLNAAASSLARLVHDSTTDVQGLFDKLERKSSIEHANRALATECRNAVSTRATTLEQNVATFCEAETAFFQGLKSNLGGLVEQTEQHLVESQSFAQNKLKLISNSLRDIRSGQMESRDVLFAAIGELEGLAQELHSSHRDSLDSLKQTCRAAIEDVVSANDQRFGQVRTSIESLVESHVVQLQQMRTTNEANLRQVAETKLAVESAAAEEVARLRAQNAVLTATVNEMKQSNEQMKTGLMTDISRLVAGFVQAQDDKLASSIAQAQQNISASEAASQADATRQSRQLDGLTVSVGRVSTQLQEAKEGLSNKSREISDEIEHGTRELASKLGDFASAVEHDLDSGAELTRQECEHLAQLAAKSRDEIETRTKSQSAKIKTLKAKATETFEALEKSIQDSSDSTCKVAKDAATRVDRQMQDTSKFAQHAASDLGALRSDSTSFLGTRFKEDVATGRTPQKRSWKMPAPWQLVPSNRQEAIEAGRRIVEVPAAEEDVEREAEDGLSWPSDQIAPTSDAFTATDMVPSSDAEDLVRNDEEAEAVVETPATRSPVSKTNSPLVGDLPVESTRRTTRIRGLRELPFGHNNVPTPPLEPTDAGAPVKTLQVEPPKTVELATLKDSLVARSRSKNKLSSTAAASTLPVSKRARS